MEVRALFGRFVWRRVNIDDITIHPSRGSRIKPALKVCEHNRVAHASKSINISTFVYLWNRVTTLNVLPKYSSMLYCCNLSAGVALNARFTTNWLCAKNNYIYTWQEQSIIEWIEWLRRGTGFPLLGNLSLDWEFLQPLGKNLGIWCVWGFFGEIALFWDWTGKRCGLDTPNPAFLSGIKNDIVIQLSVSGLCLYLLPGSVIKRV